MKRILAMLLACLMVFSMAACGNTNEQTDETQANAADPVGGEQVIPAGEGEEVELWVCQWGFTGNYADVLESLAEQATEANINGKGYNVKIREISWDGFYETFLTAYSSGTGPEIGCQANTAPIMYHMEDKICDLMPIYDQWVAENNPILDQIPQEYFDFFTIDGKLIAMPFGCDVPGVMYNEELLHDIGITEAPKTWDDILAACAALKEKYPEKYGFLHAADTPASSSNFGSWMLRQFNSSYRNTNREGNLLEADAQKVLSAYKNLVDNGYISEAVLTYSADDINRLFRNGEALFCVSGMPTDYTVEDADRFGVLEPLTVDGEQGYCQVAVNAYYIYSSDNDEAARDVLKWWMENNYALWGEGADINIPARADYCELLYANSPLCLEFFNATIGYGRITMDCWPFETQDETASDFDNLSVMGDVLTDLLNGKSTIEAGEHGNQLINDVYEKYDG